ncbi:glycosyltransferase [Vibrio sp. 1-Bac 57]
MKKRKHFIFFQPIISIHQLPLLNEIYKQGNDVTLVAFETSEVREKNSGWSAQGINENINIIIAPNRKAINKLLESNAKFVISGFCICSNTRYIMSRVREKKLSIYLYSEGGNTSSALLLPLRLLKNIYYRYKYQVYIAGIFTIGNKGYDWFRMIGFKRDKLIKFMYFTAPSPLDYKKSITISSENEKKNNIIFLGRLVEGKGLKRLLEYGQYLDERTNEINIYGGGPLLLPLRDYVEKNNLSKMINFHGIINHKQIEKVFQKATVLCLLNDGDEGWGAVVNESLLHGVPVICTPKTGSSGIIYEQNKFGVVLEVQDFNHFNTALLYCRDIDRMNIMDIAEKTLSPVVGALKLIKSVEVDDHY